jgi:MFS family permease
MNKSVTPFKRLVAALAISNLGLFICIIPPTAILLTLKLQAIAPQNITSVMGLVVSIGSFAAMISNPVAGAISDRTRLKFGRRRTWILVGSLLGGASVLGIGLAKEVWQVVLLWSCTQIFINFALSANNALIAEQVEVTKRGSISGILGSITSVAAVIGIVLVNAVGQSQMVKWSVIAIIPVVFAVIAISMIRDSGAIKLEKTKNEKLSLSKVIPSPRKHPDFAYAWLARFLVLFVPSMGTFMSLFMLQRFNLSAEELGSKVVLLTAMSTIMTFLFSVVGGFVSDYFKRQKPFVIGAGVLMGLSLIIQGFTSNFTVFIILGIVSAIGSGVFYAVDMALLTRVLPNKEDAAKDLGILNIANTLPSVIVPAIMPLLLNLGGYEVAFSFVGIIAILGAVAVLKVPEMPSGTRETNDQNDQTTVII